MGLLPVGRLVSWREADAVLERIASLLGRLFHRLLPDMDRSNVLFGQMFRSRRYTPVDCRTFSRARR